MKKHFATSTTLLETPCGQLLLGAESGRLCLCSWLRETVQTTITSDADGQLLSEACRQLQEYFAHERQEFQLPLSMHGTLFQQSAWKAMGRLSVTLKRPSVPVIPLPCAPLAMPTDVIHWLSLCLATVSSPAMANLAATVAASIASVSCCVWRELHADKELLYHKEFAF